MIEHVIRVARGALPATGDQSEGVLMLAAALALAGIGFLVWGARQR